MSSEPEAETRLEQVHGGEPLATGFENILAIREDE
jgi:hypothetical protein